MIMNTIKKCLFFVSLALLLGQFCGAMVQSKDSKKESCKVEIKAKKLTKPVMSLLNLKFEINPIVILRMNSTLTACQKTLNAIESYKADKETEKLTVEFEKMTISANAEKSNNKKPANLEKKEDKVKIIRENGEIVEVSPDELFFVKAQLKDILAPVLKFFDIIQEYSSKVKPLVEESLLSSDNAVAGKIDLPIMCKYFNCPTDITSYLEKEILTLNDLKKICMEMMQLFGDLNESLSDKAKQSYNNLLVKINNKRTADKNVAAAGSAAAAA